MTPSTPSRRMRVKVMKIDMVKTAMSSRKSTITGRVRGKRRGTMERLQRMGQKKIWLEMWWTRMGHEVWMRWRKVVMETIQRRRRRKRQMK